MIGTLALEIAGREVGVREQGGPNRGPRVEEYLRAVGLGPGYPWCAAFVCWVAGKATEEYNRRTGQDKNLLLPASGSCQVLWDFLAKKRKTSSTKVLPGWLFFLGPDRHVGWVEKVTDRWVHTLEGNTDPQGSAEGYCVARRKRKRAFLHHFADPWVLE